MYMIKRFLQILKYCIFLFLWITEFGIIQQKRRTEMLIGVFFYFNACRVCVNLFETLIYKIFMFKN